VLILECDAEVGREIGRKAGEYFHGWRHIVLKVHIAVLKCAFTPGRANIPCRDVCDTTSLCPRGYYGPPSPHSSCSRHRLRGTCRLRLPHGAHKQCLSDQRRQRYLLGSLIHLTFLFASSRVAARALALFIPPHRQETACRELLPPLQRRASNDSYFALPRSAQSFRNQSAP